MISVLHLYNSSMILKGSYQNSGGLFQTTWYMIMTIYTKSQLDDWQLGWDYLHMRDQPTASPRAVYGSGRHVELKKFSLL